MKKRRDAKTKLIIAFAVFAALSLAAIGFKALAWPAVEAALAASTADEEAVEPEEAERAATEKAAGIDEADRAKVASYGSDAKDINDLLVANRWVGRSNAGTGAYIEFGPGWCVEYADGREKVIRKFVIDAARSETSAASSRSWIFSASFGDAKSIFSLNMEEVPRPASSSQAGDELLTYSLTGPDFAYAQSYLVEKASTDFETDEVDPDLVEYLGGDKAITALDEALRDWAAKRHPSATKASWDGQAEIDYAAKTVELVFTLDDASGTKAYVHADTSKRVAAFAVGSTQQTSAKRASESAPSSPEEEEAGRGGESAAAEEVGIEEANTDAEAPGAAPGDEAEAEAAAQEAPATEAAPEGGDPGIDYEALAQEGAGGLGEGAQDEQ